jgi:carboxylesterase type B
MMVKIFSHIFSGHIRGAAHGDDIFYYFKSLDMPAIKIPSVENKLIQTMVDLITSFAISGVPTRSFEDIWAPLDKSDHVPKVLNISNSGLSMIPMPETESIKLFNEIFKEAKLDLI